MISCQRKNNNNSNICTDFGNSYNDNFEDDNTTSGLAIREGCRKSKWKFKMAFAMKGVGGLDGVSFAIKLF